MAITCSGWKADDRAAPVSLDPCIGLGPGTPPQPESYFPDLLAIPPTCSKHPIHTCIHKTRNPPPSTLNLHPGSRFHFEATPDLASRGAGASGEAERTAYEFVDQALGTDIDSMQEDRGDPTPLDVLEAQGSRIMWTSEYDAPRVAFPDPILLGGEGRRSSADSARAGLA